MSFEVLVFDGEKAENSSRKAETLNLEFNSLESSAIRRCVITDRDLVAVVAILPIYVHGHKIDGVKAELCELIVDKSHEGISRREYPYILGSPEIIMKRINDQIGIWQSEYENEEAVSLKVTETLNKTTSKRKSVKA